RFGYGAPRSGRHTWRVRVARRAPRSQIMAMRRKAIVALWILGGSAAIGFFSALHVYYTDFAEHEPNITWDAPLARQLTYWFAWGAIVPLIVWVSRRTERFNNMGARIAVLVVASIPTSVARSAATHVLSAIFVPWLDLQPHGFLLYTRAWFR